MTIPITESSEQGGVNIFSSSERLRAEFNSERSCARYDLVS